MKYIQLDNLSEYLFEKYVNLGFNFRDSLITYIRNRYAFFEKDPKDGRKKILWVSEKNIRDAINFLE